MTRPLTVIEDGPRAAAALAAARVALATDGWEVVRGLDSRPALTRAVLDGTVCTPRDAAAALLAALDGYGLLVVASAERDVVNRLVDDLRRLGPVHHELAGAAEAPAPPMSEDGRAILRLLAEGHSLGEAAAILGISRRTADRRLAAARGALGIARTTEAIAIAARRGWL